MSIVMGIYNNGNCNGFPVMCIEKSNNDFYIYNTGSRNSIPIHCYQRISNRTEYYYSGSKCGTPGCKFEFIGDTVYWYDYKHWNSIPSMCMRMLGNNAVEVYDSGSKCSWPKWYFRKCGNRIEFYNSGNANGWSVYSIDNVHDIKDVIEACLMIFIIGIR